MPKPIWGKGTDVYQKPGTTSYTALSNQGNRNTAIHRLNTNPNFNPMVNAAKNAERNRQNIGTAPKTGAGGGYTGGGYTNGGSGGGSGGAASAATAAPAATNSGMSAWQQAQQAILAAQNAAAEQLRAAQEAQRRAREEAYQKAVAQQKANYDFSVGQVNDATGNALQKAYISRMLQDKNLQQSLSAQGLNGGASETTTAGMYNNYNNARNNLETERQRQIANLLNTYQNNTAQLEQQRASGEAADLSQYQTALQNLTAGNTPNLISLLQGYSDMASSVPATTARYNAKTGQWEYV